VKICLLEIGHTGYLKKIENFMLISKMQIYLSDKMPPKKFKFKNEKNGTEQNKKTVFLIFNFGNFHLSEGLILKFINTKTEKR
jgi:hypothetical protein